MLTVATVLGLIGVFVDLGVFGEDIDLCEVVASTDLVVVEVMCRRNFDAAGAEIGIDVTVGDNRDLSITHRQLDGFPDDAPVTVVIRVNSYRGVAEHGLRSRRRHYHMAGAVGQRISNVPEFTVLFFGHDFQIGDGGMQHRVPVDQSLAAIDKVFLVQAHEDLAYGVRQTLVHRETFA